MMTIKKAMVFSVSVMIIAAMLLSGCSTVPAANAAASGAQAAAGSSGTQAAPLIPAASAVTVDPEGNRIIVNKMTVSAAGTIKVMPDVAYVDLGVTTQNKDVKKAQSDNKGLMNALYTALENGGLTKDDIKTTNYGINPLYDYSTGKNVLTAYQVVNTVEITVKDLDKIGDYIDLAAAAGANTDYSITFDLLDRNASYNQALTKAMEAAKGKADALASAGGYTIAGVLEVSEGTYNYVPQYLSGAKNDAAGIAATPITAGQLDITANITVEYQIK